MADYGHDLLFGALITPQNERPDEVVALAQLIERAGLDLVTFQDHPYQPALLALRWEDVNLADRILVVHRALSAGVEGPTKSWQARFVPLADPAAEALARLGLREHYTSKRDNVFASRIGRRLDPSALRKRFKKAAAAAGVRRPRFHALRHSAGSLIAREADARWVQGFLGHSKLATTDRYLHAKPRPHDVERLNRAFGGDRSRPPGIGLKTR